MLTKSEQAVLRARLFRHLDGIAAAAPVNALFQKGVIQYLEENGEVRLAALTQQFKAKEGYLNVALRVLASQGWIAMRVDNKEDVITYSVTDLGKAASGLYPYYHGHVELMKLGALYHPRKFELAPFSQLRTLMDEYRYLVASPKSGNALEQAAREQIIAHLEGLIVGPSVVHLGMGGMFHKYFMQASFRAEEYHEDAESFGILLDFFADLGWFEKRNATYRFTETGLFFARRASAYGVTVSYIPTFRAVDELIFGNPRILEVAEGEREKHVDREMNVWGSGGAHATYFDRVDEILIDLFNRPIAEQPSGVLDMGCGNGAFIRHIYEVIEKRTLRGTMLEEHPLILVGVDYNHAALNVTRANLIKADIWAKVIWGDISRPDMLAEQLSSDYGIALDSLLNVRTFLDHNRIWKDPTPTAGRVSNSTGAFAYKGRRLSPNLVEDNLREHLLSWKPYVMRFGLLLIELHTIPPELTASNLGRTASTAYDATHGFSDQYILEVESFYRVAGETGLHTDDRLFARFPDSELATVTVALLRGR